MQQQWRAASTGRVAFAEVRAHRNYSRTLASGFLMLSIRFEIIPSALFPQSLALRAVCPERSLRLEFGQLLFVQ